MIERREYRIASLQTMAAVPEMVISGALDDEIRARMCTVIETEAPIREALLFKRVIYSLSMKKVGSRIEPVFSRIAESLPYEKSEEDGEKVFHFGDESFFRTSIDSDRYSYQIPIEEAANCILYIIEREGRILPPFPEGAWLREAGIADRQALREGREKPEDQAHRKREIHHLDIWKSALYLKNKAKSSL